MQMLKRIASWGLRYGVLAWVAVVLVWFIIISTLRNGISCDEGYYLMGYLRNQSIEGLGTNFHDIVRALCRHFPDDNIMVFRYIRLVLNVAALLLFAGSSYEWLHRKKNLQLSRWAYYPMIALAGAMSFTFAAPTISYDSLELILVLLETSSLFLFFTFRNSTIKSICAFVVGFLLWFTCTNYPPAGVCITILFVVAYCFESGEKKWGHLLFVLIGVLVAIVISHFFIHDTKEWFSEISKVFVSTVTEESKSRHDVGSLVSVMLITIIHVLIVIIPILALFTLTYKKFYVSEKIQWVFVTFMCIILLVVKQVYELRGILYLIPIALIFAKTIAQPGFRLNDFIFSKDAILLLIFIAIPFAGVFGTNQPILKKAIIYVPFWLLAFFFLSSLQKPEANEKLNLVVIILLMAGYIWLGNFQRYHYYYTPRSSRYEIVGASRPQEIKVSYYQQQYYRDLIDTLFTHGCKPGDRYLAFGENQMAVYLAEGYIDGRLPYHWWQYKDFGHKAPKAFIIFKNEEDSVINYFNKTNWHFPDLYERIEMRQLSQNMGDDYRTVLYINTNL